MIDLGTVKPGSTIRIPFSSFDKDDGSSITMTNYAAADILIYKDGGTTERASTAGFTATTDFDGKTGKHLAVIDLADNTTSGFYNAGSEYLVAIDAVTVDAVTTGGWIARFRIGYPDAHLDTTIASLSSQTSFTLTAGPAEDDALNGCVVLIHDIASAVQHGFAVVADYTGSTKTVTLTAGVTFTAASGDNISIFPPGNARWFAALLGSKLPLAPTTAGRDLDVSAGGEAGIDWANIGSPTTAVNLSATNIDVDQVVASVSGAVASVTGNVGGNVTGSVGSVAAGGITASSIANGAIDLATFAADTLPLFGIGVSGTLSGTHSATTADLGTNAPGATSDVVGMTLWIPAKYFARVVTAYNTGTGVATFDSTSLTLANGDVWYLVGTAPGNAPTAAQIADQVWEEAIGDHSGTSGSTAEQLAAAGAAGDPWATALPGSYTSGQAGKIVGDNLNATVSSRATQTSVDTIDDFVDTEVAAIFSRIGAPVGASISADIAAVKSQTAAIETDTQDLQTQIGVAGAGLTAADDAVMARLGAPAGASVSADIAAVKAETASILTDTGTTLDGKIDTIDTVVDAIKANTDKFANLPVLTAGGTGGQGYGAP